MIRTGIGYDVHQFAEDRPLILGGVEIAHTHGLLGHSDADVLSHAIADAVLGALGLPDIGHYFPPGDLSCKDICSLRILEKCAALCEEEGYQLMNVDSTLVAEAPKILPHAPAMKEKIAEALRLSVKEVGIKATTNETMGWLGRREGMAAFATALVVKKEFLTRT